MTKKNVKKDALIEINSTQCYEGAEPEEINLVTQGKLYRKNGKYYIAYEESELTGLEDTKTVVKIAEGDVFMTRTGKYPSEMLFSENKRHVGLYHTGYGALEIATHTSRIVNGVNENGGILQLDYTVEIDHNVAGYNHFELAVVCQNDE